MRDIEEPRSDLALSELLDRALNKGVVVTGDVTISIADVDLIYLGVRLLLSSVETAGRLRREPRQTAGVGAPGQAGSVEAGNACDMSAYDTAQ